MSWRVNCTCNTCKRLQTIMRIVFNAIDILKFIDKQQNEEKLRHSGITYLTTNELMTTSTLCLILRSRLKMLHWSLSFPWNNLKLPWGVFSVTLTINPRVWFTTNLSFKWHNYYQITQQFTTNGLSWCNSGDWLR